MKLLLKRIARRHISFGTPEEDAAAAAAATAANEIKMSKTDFDKAIQEAADKASIAAKQQAKETVTRLETLSKDAKLTAEQKASLESEIGTLRAQFTTVEEQKKTTIEKLEKKHEVEISAAKKEAEDWKSRYQTYRISNDLQSAAVAENAFSAQQIVKLLMPDTTIIEKKEGDKVDYVPMVKLHKDGKELVFEPLEAVKHLKEQTDIFGNLFKANGTAGAGLLNSTKPAVQGELSAEQIAALPPKEYEEWRRTNLNQGRTGVIMTSGSGAK